jgi:hypothetical protein
MKAGMSDGATEARSDEGGITAAFAFPFVAPPLRRVVASPPVCYNPPTMKSYEVIQKAVDEPGVKAVAAALKVSQALVYKWCEPPADSEDPDQSGAKNPLDRVREMYALTKDIRLVRWLCNEAGGFFVSNPDLELRKSFDEAIFGETREMVREFSELLDTITESAETEPGIVPDEADDIREKWEDLKAVVERFVIACEKGVYHPLKKGQKKS